VERRRYWEKKEMVEMEDQSTTSATTSKHAMCESSSRSAAAFRRENLRLKAKNVELFKKLHLAETRLKKVRRLSDTQHKRLSPARQQMIAAIGSAERHAGAVCYLQRKLAAIRHYRHVRETIRTLVHDAGTSEQRAVMRLVGSFPHLLKVP
jgi:hypothetical protein